MWRTSELKCETPKILTSLIMRRPVYFFGNQQFASMLKFTTLHRCNVLFLQHGGGNHCRQNYVIVIPCIKVWRNASYTRNNYARHYSDTDVIRRWIRDVPIYNNYACIFDCQIVRFLCLMFYSLYYIKSRASVCASFIALCSCFYVQILVLALYLLSTN